MNNAGHQIRPADLLRNVLFAGRVLRRAPMFTASVGVSLALGIGAATTMFTLLQALVWRPLPVQQAEELWKVGEQYPYAAFRALSDSRDVLRGAAAFGRVRLHVVANGAAAPSVDGHLVSGDYFRLLGVTPGLGRVLGPEDDRTPGAHPVIVLSDAYWARTFDRAPDVIGRVLSVSGHAFTIVGVTPPEFSGIEVGEAPDLYLPITMQALVVPVLGNPPNLVSGQFRVVARLAPGLTPQQAGASLEQHVYRWIEQEAGGRIDLSRFGPSIRGRLQGLNLWPQLTPAPNGFSELRNRFSRPLVAGFGGVGLLLLIACANTANLLLARAASRRRELSTRLALGATRGRLVRQLLLESILLAGMGGVIGVALSVLGTRLLVHFISRGQNVVVLDLSPDTAVLLFAVALSVSTAIVFGLAPALRSTRIDSAASTRVRGETGSLTPDRVLASVQVALCLVVLTGAGLFVRSLDALERRVDSADAGRVLITRLEPAGSYSRRRPPETMLRLDRRYKELLERVRALPDVAAASLAEFTPSSVGGIRRQVKTPAGAEVALHQPMIYPGYFETMGIAMVDGRDLSASDLEPGAAPVAIVNEAFARRLYPGASAEGRPCLVMASEAARTCRIIGVVRDSPFADLQGDIVPTMYQPFLQTDSNRGMMALHVRTTGAAGGLAAAIREQISRIEPTAPQFPIHTLEAELDAVLVRQRLLALLGSLFALLAVSLACVGLYGLLCFVVTRRTSEIGVRMALGAAPKHVLRMVMRLAMTIVGAGVVLGALLSAIIASAVGDRLLSLLYATDLTDPWAAGGAVTLFALTAALAAYLPAARASRTNPVVALRAD
jgi:putative ABC transport system permease protein